MISGVGELDIEKDTPKKEDVEAKDLPYPDCPFLLLDVRDRDAYDQCHIVGGEEMEFHHSLRELGSHSSACRAGRPGFIFPPRRGHPLAAEPLCTHPAHPSLLEKDEGTKLLLIP